MTKGLCSLLGSSTSMQRVWGPGLPSAIFSVTHSSSLLWLQIGNGSQSQQELLWATGKPAEGSQAPHTLCLASASPRWALQSLCLSGSTITTVPSPPSLLQPLPKARGNELLLVSPGLCSPAWHHWIIALHRWALIQIHSIQQPFSLPSLRTKQNLKWPPLPSIQSKF